MSLDFRIRSRGDLDKVLPVISDTRINLDYRPEVSFPVGTGFGECDTHILAERLLDPGETIQLDLTDSSLRDVYGDPAALANLKGFLLVHDETSLASKVELLFTFRAGGPTTTVDYLLDPKDFYLITSQTGGDTSTGGSDTIEIINLDGSNPALVKAVFYGVRQ